MRREAAKNVFLVAQPLKPYPSSSLVVIGNFFYPPGPPSLSGQATKKNNFFFAASRQPMCLMGPDRRMIDFAGPNLCERLLVADPVPA